MEPRHSYTSVPTAVGVFNVASGRLGVVALAMRGPGGDSPEPHTRPDPAFEAWHARRFGGDVTFDADCPEAVLRAVAASIDGTKVADVRVDLSSCRPFQRRVLDEVARIPAGEVRTYGTIARAIGAERAARAVGTALARNPVPLLVPCHRVAPASGGVGGYALGPDLKRLLLDREHAARAQNAVAS